MLRALVDESGDKEMLYGMTHGDKFTPEDH